MIDEEALLEKVVMPEEDQTLNVAEIHIIDDEECHLIVNLDLRFIFAADSCGYEVVNYLSDKKQTTLKVVFEKFQDKYNRETLLSVLKEMLAVKLIYVGLPIEIDWDKRKKMTPPDFYPRNICLNITHKCNLACKYCYGDEGSFGSPNEDMTLEVAFKTVDWLIDNVKKIGAKNGELVFFGGEPLLNFKIIEPVVIYAREKAKENNVHISFTMTTNGTLMTEEIAKTLVKLDVGVMVSVDGPPDIQNEQRPYKNGGCSYDDCINGAKIFMNTAKRRISARATFVNTDLAYISNSLYKDGFRNVYLSSCSGPYGDSLRTGEGVQNVIKGFTELYGKYAETLKKSYPKSLPYNNVFVKAIKSLSNGEIIPWPCGAGRSYVGVSPSSSIYLCHRFVGNEEFYMGNVITGEIQKDLYNQVIENAGARKGKCSKCWARFYCAGGCFQHNYAHTVNIFQNSAEECEMNRRMIELGIKFYHRLFRENKELLQAICEEKPPVEHENEISRTDEEPVVVNQSS